MSTRTGIAKGIHGGHITEPIVSAKKSKPSHRKGRASKRTTFIRQIIRETAGLAPYERRILDMIKTGGASADKRIYKFAKRRLGSHKRAMKKRDQIKDVNTRMRTRQVGGGGGDKK